MADQIFDRRKRDAEMIEIKAEMKEVKSELNELKQSVDGLLTLWRDGVGAVRIIKFLSWLAVSVIGIIAAINIWGGK